MYSLITDLETVREDREVHVSVESHSLESLLVSWLNDLIFRFDTYGFIGKRIVVTELNSYVTFPRQGEACLSMPDRQAGDWQGSEKEVWQTEESSPTFRLEAVLSGEDFNPERHERRLLVKAATYHQLTIEKKEGLWVSDVILDI